MNVTVQHSSPDAEHLMRDVLRAGEPIASEYPLVFEPGFAGRIVTADSDGAVRSTCAFLERELVARTLRFKAGFIGSVATDPEYRRKGLGSNVLRAAEEELTSAGCVLSLLWADEPAYYAARGYVPIGTEFNYFIAPDMAAKLPDPSGARDASPRDVERIHTLYETHNSRVERTPDETRALLAGPGIETLVIEANGEVAAFSCMGRGADMQSVVHEWGGDPEDVLSLVHAHMLRRGGEQPAFMLVPPGARAIQEYFELSGIPGARGVIGMAKLLDARAARTLLAEALTESNPSDLAIAVAQAQVPTLVLRGPAGQIVLDGPDLLLTLFAPKGSRGVITVVEDTTGLCLEDLPLTPFVWGLDSI